MKTVIPLYPLGAQASEWNAQRYSRFTPGHFHSGPGSQKLLASVLFIGALSPMFIGVLSPMFIDALSPMFIGALSPMFIDALSPMFIGVLPNHVHWRVGHGCCRMDLLGYALNPSIEDASDLSILDSKDEDVGEVVEIAQKPGVQVDGTGQLWINLKQWTYLRIGKSENLKEYGEIYKLLLII